MSTPKVEAAQAVIVLSNFFVRRGNRLGGQHFFAVVIAHQISVVHGEVAHPPFQPELFYLAVSVVLEQVQVEPLFVVQVEQDGRLQSLPARRQLDREPYIEVPFSSQDSHDLCAIVCVSLAENNRCWLPRAICAFKCSFIGLITSIG